MTYQCEKPYILHHDLFSKACALETQKNQLCSRFTYEIQCIKTLIQSILIAKPMYLSTKIFEKKICGENKVVVLAILAIIKNLKKVKNKIEPCLQ